MICQVAPDVHISHIKSGNVTDGIAKKNISQLLLKMIATKDNFMIYICIAEAGVVFDKELYFLGSYLQGI